MVETLEEASRQGIGVSRQQLLKRRLELCKRLRVSPFKKINPSKDLWNDLRKRHIRSSAHGKQKNWAQVEQE